jgi:hypothetical protein
MEIRPPVSRRPDRSTRACDSKNHGLRAVAPILIVELLRHVRGGGDPLAKYIGETEKHLRGGAN